MKTLFDVAVSVTADQLSARSFDMKKPIEKLEDMDLWVVGIDFAVAVHDLTKRLPADERFGLVFQLRKCSVSIPSNVAEGFGRRTTGEYKNSLSVADGENREAYTQLIIIQRKRYIAADDDELVRAINLSRRIGQMLTALQRSLGD
jgi:four helix bundle protein